MSSVHHFSFLLFFWVMQNRGYYLNFVHWMSPSQVRTDLHDNFIFFKDLFIPFRSRKNTSRIGKRGRDNPKQTLHWAQIHSHIGGGSHDHSWSLQSENKESNTEPTALLKHLHNNFLVTSILLSPVQGGQWEPAVAAKDQHCHCTGRE